MAYQRKDKATPANELPEHVAKAPKELRSIVSVAHFTYMDGKPTLQYGHAGDYAWQQAFFKLPELRRVYGESIQIMPRQPEKRSLEAMVAENLLTDSRQHYTWLRGRGTPAWRKLYKDVTPHPLVVELATLAVNSADPKAAIASAMPDAVRKKTAEVREYCAKFERKVTTKLNPEAFTGDF